MTRFWDGRIDGRTDRWSDCTPRPAFAFGDAGKNQSDLASASSYTNLEWSVSHSYLQLICKTMSSYKTERICNKILAVNCK